MEMMKTPIRLSIVWLVGLCLSGGAQAQVSFDIPVEEPTTYSNHYETIRLPVEQSAAERVNSGTFGGVVTRLASSDADNQTLATQPTAITHSTQPSSLGTPSIAPSSAMPVQVSPPAIPEAKPTLIRFPHSTPDASSPSPGLAPSKLTGISDRFSDPSRVVRNQPIQPPIGKLSNPTTPSDQQSTLTNSAKSFLRRIKRKAPKLSSREAEAGSTKGPPPTIYSEPQVPFVLADATDGQNNARVDLAQPDSPSDSGEADSNDDDLLGDSDEDNSDDADQPTPTADHQYNQDGSQNWGVVTCEPTSVSQRLFNYGYDKNADITTTGMVDLSEPISPPHADHRAGHVPFHAGDFAPMPDYSQYSYDGNIEQMPYYGKYLVPGERPWVELGRGMYLNGPIPQSQFWLGETNPVAPHFLVYGDYRTAVGYVDNGNGDKWVNAHRLNLDLDLKITATERVHAFIGPLDRGANFTRVEYDNGELDFEEEFDADFDTIYFEGDLGAMIGGAMGIYPPFDMPVAFGILPLLFQNGTWLNDNFLGAAVTIPAKNAPRLQWSNFDVTLFAGIDEVNSGAFPGDDSQAHMYGAHAFIEAYTGYLEVGYAFLDDQLNDGLSYHNVGVSFSRRYFQRISNSIRFIANFGQDPNAGDQTADGQLVLIENALITAEYTNFVPYMNLFAGFGRPQSAARAGAVGGVLLNTGINFETDGLIGFPRLDDTANDTVGGAIGLNILGSDLGWQVITEFAAVATHGNDPNRNAPDNQYGFGVRVQRPISNAWLIRADGMYGVRRQLSDISGARLELRYKF